MPTQHDAIVIQYPIVAILFFQSYQAQKAFRMPPFGLIAAGWCLNLAYLLAKTYIHDPVGLGPYSIPPTLPAQVFVFAGSFCFWSGARNYVPLESWMRLPKLHDAWFGVVSGGILAWTLTCMFCPVVFRSLSDTEKFLLAAVPDTSYDVLAILAMSQFFRQFLARRHPSRRRPRASWLYLGALSYGMIQVIYLLTMPPLRAYGDLVNATGFFLGFVAKFMMLYGFIALFGDATARLAQEGESERIVGRLAHELNTPISELIVNTATLRQARAVRHGFGDILARLESAANRVQAIMEASSQFPLLRGLFAHPAGVGSEAPSSRAEPAAVSVNRITQVAIMAVKETRDEAVRYRIKYSARACVRVVEGELVQVVINLLRNAYDALPSGAGDVEVETHNIDAEVSPLAGQAAVQLVISDNGSGLTPFVEAHMYEDGFSTRAGRGRGHGLSVVRSIVEHYQGCVTIENRSPEGDRRGCRVTIHLPRVAGEQSGQKAR